jgi:hypothetical protein
MNKTVYARRWGTGLGSSVVLAGALLGACTGAAHADAARGFAQGSGAARIVSAVMARGYANGEAVMDGQTAATWTPSSGSRTPGRSGRTGSSST